MTGTANIRPALADLLWWIGAIVSSGLVLLGGCTLDLSRLPAQTPFDNTRSGHAEQWRFLRGASALVPPGATFTIRARDPDLEMSLYMMAVGLLPEATAIPNTYYGRPVAASDSARFVLDFGVRAGNRDDPERTVASGGGSVIDRGAPGP